MPKKMFTRSKMSCYILIVQYLVLREDLLEVFCVLQITLGILKFKLALVTSDNTQVRI